MPPSWASWWGHDRRRAVRRDDEHPGPHLLRRPRYQELQRDRPRVVPLLPPPWPSRRAPLRVRAPLGRPAVPLRLRDPGGQPMTVYYKCLDPGGRSRFGTGTWHLPDGVRPGKWMPEITRLVPCQQGYHVAAENQLIDWLGPELFEVECRGEHIDHGDKHVFGQARLVRRISTWNDRTARLFAADCAERALPVFEACCPGDMRPHHAIEVARAFADGQATVEDLAAARDAAKAAAERAAKDAPWDAAWDAGWAAARGATGGAAWAAARAAAMDAALAATRAAAGEVKVWTAAWTAAWDAEREWQTRRLFQLIGADR